MPITYKAGFAYKFFTQDLYISLDISKSKDTDPEIRNGFQYGLIKYMTLRLGNNFKKDDWLNPSFGVGFKIERSYLVDYTFIHLGDLGSTHRIGITFRFNIPKIINGRGRIKITYPRTAIPTNLMAKLVEDKLVLTWDFIENAKYNVYARQSLNDKWKRLNKELLPVNKTEYKKPDTDVLYFCITAVVKGVESEKSKPVKVEIKE